MEKGNESDGKFAFKHSMRSSRIELFNFCRQDENMGHNDFFVNVNNPVALTMVTMATTMMVMNMMMMMVVMEVVIR